MEALALLVTAPSWREDLAMTREQLQAERDDLARKLKARERTGSGYTKNLTALRARIDAIDSEIEALGND